MHRSCRVTVTGLDGVMYSVVVTAESVYEAIALGMTEIRNSPWTGKIAESLFMSYRLASNSVDTVRNTTIWET
jgi:hypothetical protein